MGRFVWDEALALGIPMVDEDHKVLIRLINEVEDCIGRRDEFITLASVLNMLADYTHYHFSREEKLQVEIDYPGRQQHQQVHRSLAGQVDRIYRRYEANQRSINAREVFDFLCAWLTDHILTQDMAYRPYALKASGVGASAAPGWLNAGVELGGRVLVVDGNAGFRTVLDVMLTRAGASVRLADSAEAGLAALAEPADVVLFDWALPGCPGVEFAAAARKLAPAARLVGLWAPIDGDSQTLGEAAGVVGFIAKPLSTAAVLETVGECLGRPVSEPVDA